MHWVFYLHFSFFFGMNCFFKHAQSSKLTVIPLGNEYQIPLIEYSKTTNSTASLAAAISKK